MSDLDHDCDHDKENEGYPVYEKPTWRFTLWDVANIGVQVIGGIFTTLGQGSQLLAMELAAHAKYKRQAWSDAEIEAWTEQRRIDTEREMAEILGLPTAPLDEIPEAER